MTSTHTLTLVLLAITSATVGVASQSPIKIVLVLASKNHDQYEPLYATARFINQRDTGAYASIPRNLSVYVRSEGKWVSPYDLPGAGAPRPRTPNGARVWIRY